MNPLLISGFGTSLYVDKRRLDIQNKLNDERLEFYPHQIDHDSIIVDGHTGNISFEAIRLLMKHGIDISLLNWDGSLLSVIMPQEPKNGKLRVAQYQAYLDSKKRFSIASEIVRHKIEHSENVLRELGNYYKDVNSAEVERIFRSESNNFTVGVQTINNLLNYEGRIATFYGSTLARIFPKLQPDFHFVKRGSKSYSWNMNASDEVNALINYGYAILESEVRKCVNAVGLDPSVGFLHELAQSKQPLVYDLYKIPTSS